MPPKKIVDKCLEIEKPYPYFIKDMASTTYVQKIDAFIQQKNQQLLRCWFFVTR